MMSRTLNFALPRLQNRAALCHRWTSAFGELGLASNCCPITNGRCELDVGHHRSVSNPSACGAWSLPTSSAQPPLGQVLKRHGLMSDVRFAATAATAPTSAKVDATPSAAPVGKTTSSSKEDAFLVGLAQRYPDPDTIPEHILRRIRHRLFGKPIQPGEQTGRRVLARPLQGRILADWYFMPPSELPGFHNEEREYELSKALNRRHRKEDGMEGDDAATDGKAAAGGKKK